MARKLVCQKRMPKLTFSITLYICVLYFLHLGLSRRSWRCHFLAPSHVRAASLLSISRSGVSDKCQMLEAPEPLLSTNTSLFWRWPWPVAPASPGVLQARKPSCSPVCKHHSNHSQAFKKVKGEYEMVFLTVLEIPILRPETLLITHCHTFCWRWGKSWA